jgi:hypothetical protein
MILPCPNIQYTCVRPSIEVLVKAEHDFYREKWQKEKNRSRIKDLTSL